ncbi:allophanate hydrolase [Paenibacillus cisolokensis]|uniref:allophanate hydrolase n=1 Tax=Paenibacillus cisolokensis TaxID=1658519 RepID=UPI003D2B79F8
MGKRFVPRKLTVNSLRKGYLARNITPEDVVGCIIERSVADADMNIWITPPRMERIRPYIERLAALDPAKTPLWGIPFAIKDNIDWAGVPTTAGCPDFQYVPAEHASAVARLIEAGAIPLGKTNLDQFATGLVGTRSPYGETHNALRPELISGGSSSGSAVAVARGQAAFALGTDTAGSGRVPAALNGLVGFKPTIGAWPTKGVVPACASLDCVTVFAHSAEEALQVDRVLRGPDPADPWSRSVAPPMPRMPHKLCLPGEPLRFYGPYAVEYAQAWEAAVDRLKHLNVEIEYVDIRLFARAAAMLYDGPYVGERWASLGGFIDDHPGSVLPVTEQVLRSGAAARYGAASVFRVQHQLQEMKLEARKLLERAVLVLPTAGGTWSREQVRESPIETNSEMGRYTNHCNLLDLCALAVPAGEAADGLPFGITLFALAEDEGLLFGLERRLSGGDRTVVASRDVPNAAVEDITGNVPAAASGDITGSVSAAVSGDVIGKVPAPVAGDRTVDAPAVVSGDITGNVPAASGDARNDMPEDIPNDVPACSETTESGGARAGVLVAVCGLHMRGYPLESQMRELGARFVREDRTAAKYRMIRLPSTPAKPGLIKQWRGGSSIAIEVWEMPAESFGPFVSAIPAPLGIGKVELQDGTEIPGFICEAYAENEAEDITGYGGWRAAT